MNCTSTPAGRTPLLLLFVLLISSLQIPDAHTAAATNSELLRRLTAAAAPSSALSSSNHIADGAPMKYDAPDDCRFHIQPNQDVALTCSLRTVNSEFDTTNFSVIPAEHTVALFIQCNDTILARSSLEPGSFDHLARLGELSMEYCKLARLQPDALHGLGELRNLSLRTHNVNWAALSLELEADAFVHTRQLERLDLSMNNIWSLPEGLFCALSSLRALNMSWNRLQDVNDLGFREKQCGPAAEVTTLAAPPTTTTVAATPAVSASPVRACSLDLEWLDVSHNHFVLLPACGFGILRRLRRLSVRANEISMVDDKALRGLKNLQIIDMSSNKIVALPSELFADPAQSIQEIYLQNNSISVLAPKLFANLEQLQTLDLADNKITSTWIDRTTFAGLIRLVLLNLSNNRITKLEPEFFADLYTLQILNLGYNQLETIAADTFAPMNNLHTLSLSHNSLKYLDAYSLNGLYVLSYLSIDKNQLSGLHPEAFRNCSSLQELHLAGNQLKTVPLALKDMRLLRTIDLGENQIEELSEHCFRGMSNMYGLRMMNNRLENLTATAFKDLPSLQILNMAGNRIRHVEQATFEAAPSIQAIRLDGNQLTATNGLFTHMPNLLWMNISENYLTEFDYSEVPRNMLWLNVARNEIDELTDKFAVNSQLKMQTLDASFNHIRHVGPTSVPNSIELLFLNDNWITTVEPHTFMHKTNLTRVDLYANQITGLDEKSLRLLPVSPFRQLPEFYIGGNPFVCDCNIDWLQKINQVTSRQYPRIMDLETVYCKLPYNRDRSFISLIDADPSHFLCQYKAHCFALCHCCDFDACDCEMTCPQNCTCFHDQSWNTNVVECTAVGYEDMPQNIPMDITELYIDGNDMAELSGHSFIGRKNLRVLHANNSNIQAVFNTTFIGLRALTVLHLENNRIARFMGNELDALDSLRELYLQNNRITFIDNRTFAELRKLEVLRLDNNKLMHFAVWQLALNPYLVEIGLADNMWSCECDYLGRLREFLHANGEKIFDSGRIACVYNNLTSVLHEQNGAKCALKDGDISTVAHTAGGALGGAMAAAENMETMLPFLLAATCAFVGFFGAVLGAFCYRRELADWWQRNSCAAALCYKSSDFHHPDDYDKDRLYDAYISYSLQDEHFVNQILANTLENNIGYRLCLHYRDFNVNTYVADTIVEAVDSSRRTLLVLSRNFLYNEWSRFEVKSALHECVKRRRKLVFILYGDLPQRDIDADMRMYLRASTCIEWDDKKFWQKLRMAMPNLRGMRGASGANSSGSNCLAKRSAVNIYATTTGSGGGGGQYHQQLHAGLVPPPPPSSSMLGGTLGRVGVHPMAGLPPMPGHVTDYHTGHRRLMPVPGMLVAGNGVSGGGGATLPLDCNNYATINDCGRNCDKYESVLCKYSTNSERQRGQQQLLKTQQQQQQHQRLGPSKTLDRQFNNHHEYAVPSNLLQDDDDDDNCCDVRIDPACYGSGKTSRSGPPPAAMVATNHSGGPSPSTSSRSGGSLPSDNVFSFNSSQNCNNCDNTMCAGDESCAVAASLNSTLAAADMANTMGRQTGGGGGGSCMPNGGGNRQQQQQLQQQLWA